ncbi:IS630 transposase-related protein [Candidatus Lariskella endosymbiont of Epinotia ramella]|uniref:IS630 transposase-related protein n=1 Tax=Candidatus Lariskella endosymbiont of Epinotia ramella TaxID=3066224 RepID=UPI0030D448FC
MKDLLCYAIKGITIEKKMTYPLSFRKKILKIKAKEELSFSEVAKKFGISKAAIFRWSQNIEPQKYRHKKWSKIDVVALKKDIEEYPDSYCYERAARLCASTTGIRDAQYRLGVSYKKNSKSSKSGSRKKIYVLPKDC